MIRQGFSFNQQEVERISDWFHFVAGQAQTVTVTTTEDSVIFRSEGGHALAAGTRHRVTGPLWSAVCSCGGFNTVAPAWVNVTEQVDMQPYLDAITDHLEGRDA